MNGGYVDGALICKRTGISESATVLGNVVTQVVVVEGKVDGSIFADRLTLAASCKVHGDVHHRDLRLHEGCYFEGKSRHSKKAARSGQVALRADDENRVLI